MISNYIFHLLTLFILAGMMTVCLDIIIGYVGYLHLGHVAYWAIGSYTYALLLMRGVPFFIAMLAAGIVTGVAGLIIGFPTLRLKTHFIAIASLGFLFITRALLTNLTDLTRGPLGIPGIPRPFAFVEEWQFFLLTAGISLVVGFVIYRILHSPFGTILKTIREDEVAAKALGKNTFMYKLIANILCAFFVGIMSALSASFYQYISPFGFGVPQMIFFLSALMVGGAGFFWGGFAGAIIILGLEEITRFLPLPVNAVGPLRTMIYATILVVIMLYRPNGLLGKKIINYK